MSPLHLQWHEFTRQRKRKIVGLLGSIDQVKDRLGEWDQDTKGISDTKAGLETYLGKLENLFAEKAKAAGIRILPLPKLDVGKLMRMSMDCVPPSEESEESTREKGFRDSLIMFTILEEVRKRPEENSLVITADKLLTKELRLFADEFETQVETVESLDEAIEYIDDRVDAWYRDKLRRESLEAQEMLLRYRDQIAAQVQAIRELTDVDLGLTLFRRILRDSPLEQGETIEKVNSLVLDSIESAIWKDKEQPVSRILFRIRCTANVVTSSSPFNPFLLSSKYTVGGEKQITTPFFTRTPTKEKTLAVRLYGEAHFKQVEGGWELVGAKVAKAPPPPEELVELSRAEFLALATFKGAPCG